MKTVSPRFWTVAFLEGFSTLAVEVIGIRLAVPLVGSSMTLTGVMLGVILFALSAGYWRGGELSSRWDNGRTRNALTRNLLLAGVMYAAVSFPLEPLLLEKTLDLEIGLAWAIGIMASLLFVLPVYLASQAVPMLAELVNSQGKAGKASGKVLFFSTLGSVAGGILTPVWLFPSFGVRASTYVVCGLLLGAAAIMAARNVPPLKMFAGSAAVAALVTLAGVVGAAAPEERYRYDSAYQSIRIIEETGEDGRVTRVLSLGGGRASGIYAENGETAFVSVLEADKALAAVPTENVLAIGAAGFTFPRDASRLPIVKRVDTVDVDPVVRRVAEEQFLREPLPSKVRFYARSARFAVRQFRKEGRQYGFTFIDAYAGRAIPDELVTVEFFSDVRAVSDTVMANIIMDKDMESAYARNVLASFRRAFGHAWVKNAYPGKEDPTNMMVMNKEFVGSMEWKGAGTVYTDNLNTADRDHVELLWGSGE